MNHPLRLVLAGLFCVVGCGSSGSGSTTGSGGAFATGGAIGSGGKSAAGGISGSGGTAANGGATGAGGASQGGGGLSRGGAGGNGGAAGRGGATGSGGSEATGGTTGACVPTVPTITWTNPYVGWSRGIPTATDPTFFPIAVWLQDRGTRRRWGSWGSTST